MAAKKTSTKEVEKKNVEAVEEETSVEETQTDELNEENTVPTAVEEETNTDIEEEMTKGRVIGEIVGNGTKITVKQPVKSIKFEAQVAPVPMFKLPQDIQNYLMTKGFGTNVWKKDKEWLEKHGADMKMIEKLKKFLSGNL